MEIKRTNSEKDDFKLLVTRLEAELKIRDGDDHVLYAEINKVDKLDYAIVVYIEDQPVACGAFRILSADAVEMKRLFVLQEKRKSGIASRVLVYLEQWALELGYRHCLLETGINQPEAIALYKKFGYEQIPKFGKYRESANSVCFEKSLAN